MFKIKLGTWGAALLTVLYISVLDLFFKFIINREVEGAIQVITSFLVLMYSVWYFKTIINFINKKTEE
jgi:hypothetical protein